MINILLALIACNEYVDSDEYIDTSSVDFVCTDGRGYDHLPGTFWQCDSLCLTCTCTDHGEIILAPSGPKIVTSDCKEEEKPMGPQLPPSPK